MMASNGGQDVKDRKGQLSPNEETPEEQQLQRDLKHLDYLLSRCREIRTTIPRMLDGMPEVARKHQDSREALFAELVNHMKNADTEIQDFATLYTSEESKRVLDKAKESRATNPKGIKTWLYQDHPNWADVSQ
ncbi:hypothetical protein F4860DRAFT_484038 [Xylaria cubensis]|nr:hypothetical protein F4860DRAFT_484038 [Xylaria cubensis]